MHKLRMKHLFLTAALLALSPALQSAPLSSGQEVASCMRANLPRHFSVEDFVLSSRSANGHEEVMTGQIYFSRENRQRELGPARAMMHIENPAALRDSSYLLIETDDYLRDGMFVFLPAINRVRRVSGTMADGQLFGTDFSYHDFKLFRSALRDMNAGEMKPSVFNGRPSYQLRFTPKTGVETPYDFVDAQIDAQSCLPLILHIHEQGHLKKTLEVPAHAFEREGDYWYAREFTIRDLQSKTSSTLRTTGYDTQTRPPEALFNPATFYRRF